MPAPAQLSGQRFGRLLVLESVGRDKNYHVLWRCKCDCGNEAVTRSQALLQGKAISCGCYNREVSRNQKPNLMHGQSRTRLWRIWWGMKARCRYPTASGYQYYGAIGITVCPEWQTFDPFQSWALANGYADDLTLDRWPDQNGNYEPSNCRWATAAEQASNRRKKRG